MSRFPRKPIPAGIPDLPDLYIRKLSLAELFDLQAVLGNGDESGALGLDAIRRILVLGLADASGVRLIPDGSEKEADDLGADAMVLVKRIMDHNGLGAEAKNESSGPSGN
jgi:hypothetical protein